MTYPSKEIIPTLDSIIQSNMPMLLYTPKDENEGIHISVSCVQAAGFDQTGIVKKVIPVILKTTCCNINRSLATGTVPNHINVAQVVPIFKKTDWMRCDDYRPI